MHSKQNNEAYKDQVVEVLIDNVSPKDETVLQGYTDTWKLVNVKADPSYLGKIVKVKITKANTWNLAGELDE
jgi:tRNA-2-methylthio-N6-dimethylallyladenosine synthase